MRKRLLGILLVALMLLSISLGAFAEASKIDVVMWGWGDDWRRSFVDYMTDKSLDINFEYVAVNGDDYLQKLQTSAASGTRMPDIAAMEMGWRGKAIALGIFENLEAAPYNLDRTEIMDFLIPLCTDADDIVRGVEIQPAPGGLAYRRDLAIEYLGTDDALELEAMLASWDDYITVGQDVLEKSGGKVRMFASIDDVASIMISQSAVPYTKDGKSNLNNALLGPMTKTKELYDAGIVDTLGNMTPAWYASLSSGEYIFYPCPSWYPFYIIAPNDPDGMNMWGIMMPPDTAYNMGGTLFGIPSMAGTPESRLEAWNYIKWFTLSEEGSVWIRDNWDSPSSYKPIYTKEGFFDGCINPYFGLNLSEIFLRMSGNVTARQIGEYDNVVSNDLALGYRALEMGATPEEAVAEIEESILKQAPELQ